MRGQLSQQFNRLDTKEHPAKLQALESKECAPSNPCCLYLSHHPLSLSLPRVSSIRFSSSLTHLFLYLSSSHFPSLSIRLPLSLHPLLSLSLSIFPCLSISDSRCISLYVSLSLGLSHSLSLSICVFPCLSLARLPSLSNIYG